MTEDWRRALDNNETVGIAFVYKVWESQETFGCGSRMILLTVIKLLLLMDVVPAYTELLLVFHKDVCSVPPYSHSFVTIYQTLLLTAKLNLMSADDTTINVTGSNPDMVATSLNFILSKLTDWYRHNFLTPHPCKTEFMLMNVEPLLALDRE